MKSKLLIKLTPFICLSLAPGAFAVTAGDLLPGSVQPGVISKTLSAQPIEAPSVTPAPLPQVPEQAGGGLGPEAEKIKFRLTKIIIDGEKVYTEEQLSHLYKDKINKMISIAELQNIVQSITNYYRNNGYILSRAVLPPQRVVDGVIHITVLEGYISAVTVQGDPKRARCILQLMGNRITESRPVQLKVMEHYLRIVNEIPGATVKSVLEPSKKETGASDMSLVAQQKTLSGYYSYDNFGTRYIGPQQNTASITANSVFQSGDSSHFTMVRTAKPRELHYVDASHDFPMSSSGLRGSVGANYSRTFPKFTLSPLKIDGDSANFYGTVTYPVIRSRERDLTIDGGVNYIDSGTDSFNIMLYNDHLRTANFGFSYNSSDSWKGANLVGAHLEHGFEILGASSDPFSPHVSRFGADGHFTKIYGNVGRLQTIKSKLSIFFYGTGQYSFNPLLATEQFAFGGSQIGRGYDPAEIIGDRGAAASAELRLDLAPDWFFLKTAQPYAFYDAGVIWNIRNVLGVQKKMSATSMGIGSRFVLSKYFSGNVFIAQPLTKEVATMELIGRGRLPRSFFSLVASA